MTWTAPESWTAGEEVHAADLNSTLRDNMNFLNVRDLWCRARLTGSPPAVANQTDTLVPLNTVDAGDDPSAMFNVSTHLATIQVKGLYLVSGGYRLVTSGPTVTAPLACSLYKNATSGLPQFVGANVAGTGAQVTRVLPLVPGDTIGLNCWQASSVSVSFDLGFGGTGNHLSVVCLHRMS